MAEDHGSTTVLEAPEANGASARETAWEYCQLMLVREGRGKRELSLRLASCEAHPGEVVLERRNSAEDALASFRGALASLGRDGWELADINLSFAVELDGQVHFPSTAAMTGRHTPTLAGATAWFKRKA